MGWVTKTLPSRAPLCFGRHVKLLLPAAFAVVNTHQSALGHKEGLCPSSGDINRLMIMILRTVHPSFLRATSARVPIYIHTHHSFRYVTAGWSSGLRPRLQNQRLRVQILVVSRGFCNKQLHLLTSHGCLYIL
jgi:hypothetical protein